MVHSWFANTDNRDSQFEGHSFGWHSFFQILRLYLQSFNGRPSKIVQLLATSAEAREEAWNSLISPLGLSNAKAGEQIAMSDVPSVLSGAVEVVNPPEWSGLILRLDKPCPGIAHLFALPMGGQTLLSVRFYVYGAVATDIAENVRTSWEQWFGRMYPPAGKG